MDPIGAVRTVFWTVCFMKQLWIEMEETRVREIPESDGEILIGVFA